MIPTLPKATNMKCQKLTLHESCENLAPSLQQWVADDDLQESLQPFAAVLDHVVTEAVGKDLAG